MKPTQVIDPPSAPGKAPNFAGRHDTEMQLPVTRPGLARSMRASVLMAPRTLAIRKLALPAVPPGTVRVQLHGCGICGSNLPVWEGRPWFHYPLNPGAPGHEGWGVIDAVADNVAGLRPGDHVTILSYHAFAQYDVADAAHVVSLPSPLRGRPFPGEALGCAMNIFKRSDIQAGQTVAVVGVGFIGALLAQLAHRSGARVIGLCRREFAVGVARRMGASDVVGLEPGERAVQEVMELTGGCGCERVIEATGRQQPLDVAGQITRERGRLIIAGYHQDGPRQVNMQQWNWRGLDVINAHERDPKVYIDGMRAAVEAVAAGRLDPGLLYTHEFKLGALSRGLDALMERPMNFMKALVRYD